MSAFHYFLPDVGGPNAVGEMRFCWKQYGALAVSLKDVLKSPGDATAYKLTLPFEGQVYDGTLVTPNVNGTAPNVVTFQPDKQTWIRAEMADGKFILVGWENDNPPTPSSLARRKQYAGYTVDDASGVKWSVPIARAKDGGASTLPSDFEFDPITGHAIERPNADYDDLWAISGDLYDHWNTDEIVLPPAKLAEYATAALAVNYRVGPIELNAFRRMGRKVVDAGSAATIGLALIDLQMMALLQKKTTTEPTNEQASPTDV